MYSVSVFMRDRLVEVARRRYGSLAEALSGRVILLQEFRDAGLKVRVTSVRRTSP